MPITFTTAVRAGPCARAETEPAPHRRALEPQEHRRHEHPDERAHARPR